MSEDPAEASMVAGRYRLEYRIAVGGMATVHRALDTVLDRSVAIKILHEQFAADPAFVARFKREAQAAARLGHPNVVAIYDWGPHSATYFIAMELIEGRTLADELAETGPLALDAALSVALDVSRALVAAHEQGTIHRDIKPSNIILEPTGRARVADFGIARAREVEGDGDLTDVGSVLGTAGYLSPEQAQGDSVDPRSDLYSLGIVLFEMVTGRRPFVGTSPMAVLRQHISDPPPSVRNAVPSAPPELSQLIDDLLAKNPGHRPATARNLADRLQNVMETERRASTSSAGHGEATAVPSSGAEPGVADAQDRLPPTAVMPPSKRPDRHSVEATPASEQANPRSPFGWPVVVGAIAVVGVVAGLLIASQLFGGDTPADVPDDAPVPTASTETTAQQTSTDPTDGAISVPNVLGSSQADAEAAITDLGLRPVVETEEVADNDRVGRVVAQSPDPDQTIDSGGEVRIVIGVAEEATTTTTDASTTTSSSAETTATSTTVQGSTTSEAATSTTEAG